ncbi:protein-disulfide reductase DsbD N-terminal domain-containing protein [bacterium]|nr:protein-disulfide reductase DsbD N-terminal domain-containing protein [bacterium]
MRKLTRLGPLFLLLALAGCERGVPAPSDDRPVVVSMVREPADPSDGRTLTVAWHFRIADGWHLYWDGLNDSGAPPSIELDLPDGWRADPPRWPAPRRLVSPGGILDHVYHHELVLLQDLHPAGDAQADFGAKLAWLVCRDVCVMGDTTLTSTEAAAPPDVAGFFAKARSRLPTTMPAGHYGADWEGTTLRVSLPRVEHLEFLPAADCGRLAAPLEDTAAEGQALALRFEPVDGAVGPARGLVRGTFGDHAVSFHIDIPRKAATNPNLEDDDD